VIEWIESSSLNQAPDSGDEERPTGAAGCARPPFGSPEQVLTYLARYTHRIAISNPRLVRLEDGQVTFTYKDYTQDGRRREMTLAAEEFIRRFLLHVLPAGFVRIRYYGLLANRHRTVNLAQCRELQRRRDDGRIRDDCLCGERGLASETGTADGQGSDPVPTLWSGPPAPGGRLIRSAILAFVDWLGST
jgi:hypothetical protein